MLMSVTPDHLEIIMRRILVSSLFLSTVLLNAQADTKGQRAVLEARNEVTSAPATAAPLPATDVNSSTQGRRISTGITWPKLISQPNFAVSTTDFPTEDLAAQHVVVSFRVDENGTPQNVHVVQSVNQNVDERVMTAVRSSRYVPAKLDDQIVPVDVNLLVNFRQR
jgi:TonB family protein